MKKFGLRQIPKPKINEATVRCIPHPQIGREEHLLFSYEQLDKDNPYYNVNTLCDKGIQHWITCLVMISKISCRDLCAGRYERGPLRFHPHRHIHDHDIPQIIQDNPELEDCFFQIRFGSNKGGIHGIVIDNVFYVIWFDPRHIYYWNSRYGPKKKLNTPGDCCCERDKIINDKNLEIDQLRHDKQQLQNQNDELMNILDEKTS